MKPIITKLPQNSENGSCHYCEKGKLRENHRGMDYPYSEIIRIEGNHISSNFCPDCFEAVLNFLPKAIEPTESPSHGVTEAEAFGNDCKSGQCS